MSTHAANYHQLAAPPAWTAAVWTGTGSDRTLANEPDPYKWSGKNPPPAIGERVHVYMNGLGAGRVTGYFAEYGWFGVLVRLENPPAWHVKQNGRDCLAHIFGAELEPRGHVLEPST